MNLLSIVVLFAGVFLASFVIFLGVVDFFHPIADGSANRFSVRRNFRRRE